LENTLKLTQYLIKLPQYAEPFKSFFPPLLLKILIGKNVHCIPGAHWSEKVIKNSIILLIQFLSNDPMLIYGEDI